METHSDSSPKLSQVEIEVTPPRINRQLYGNSSLAGSVMEELSLDSLHGAKLPNLAIEHEKPEHRLILILKFQGLSNTEIAKQTGYTDSWISQICRQPWFRVRLMGMFEEAGQDALQKLIEVEAPNSLQTLVVLRDSAESEQVRASCAIHILDRHMGKPTQKTEVKSQVTHTIAKMEDIDRQLAEVEAEERRLIDGR